MQDNLYKIVKTKSPIIATDSATDVRDGDEAVLESMDLVVYLSKFGDKALAVSAEDSSKQYMGSCPEDAEVGIMNLLMREHPGRKLSVEMRTLEKLHGDDCSCYECMIGAPYEW